MEMDSVTEDNVEKTTINVTSDSDDRPIRGFGLKRDTPDQYHRNRWTKAQLMGKTGYKYLKLTSIIITFIILGLLGNKEMEQNSNCGGVVMEDKIIHSICLGTGRQISLNPVLSTDDFLYICNVSKNQPSESKVILTLYKGSRWLGEWNRLELDNFKKWLKTNGFYSSCYSHNNPCTLYMSSISFCLSDDGNLAGITFLYHNISLDEISSSNFIMGVKQFGQ